VIIFTIIIKKTEIKGANSSQKKHQKCDSSITSAIKKASATYAENSKNYIVETHIRQNLADNTSLAKFLR